MRIRFAVALLATSILGCGSADTIVSGTVTVNNQPLQHGYITFFPVEGTKAVKGAPVTDGKFALAKMLPGKCKAVIAETPNVQLAQHPGAPPTLTIVPSANGIS